MALEPNTEEKDIFKCKFCDKAFSVSSNRNRHVRRVHEDQSLAKKVSCPHCEYRCRDKYQLKVHVRSHTREKPFACEKCSFQSSKKEDCRRHMVNCKGPKYCCSICGKTFKSRSSVNDHYIWDPHCGTLSDRQTGNLPGEDNSVVKIDIEQGMTVVGVNCQEFLDLNMFDKRSRKTKCGLCYSCLIAQDCGNCKVCTDTDRGSKTCIRRACHKPLDLYQVKKVDNVQILDNDLTNDNILELKKDEDILTKGDVSFYSGEIGSDLVVESVIDELGDECDISQVILLNENVLQVSEHQDIIC